MFPLQRFMKGDNRNRTFPDGLLFILKYKKENPMNCSFLRFKSQVTVLSVKITTKINETIENKLNTLGNFYLFQVSSEQVFKLTSLKYLELYPMAGKHNFGRI